jgi:hypothetical protein
MPRIPDDPGTWTSSTDSLAAERALVDEMTTMGLLPTSWKETGGGWRNCWARKRLNETLLHAELVPDRHPTKIHLSALHLERFGDGRRAARSETKTQTIWIGNVITTLAPRQSYAFLTGLFARRRHALLALLDQCPDIELGRNCIREPGDYAWCNELAENSFFSRHAQMHRREEEYRKGVQLEIDDLQKRYDALVERIIDLAPDWARLASESNGVQAGEPLGRLDA